MSSEHIVRAYDSELEKLGRLISEMGGLAEAQVAAAVQAASKRDTELASQVMRDDSRLDELEREIDNEVIRLLALRQPMARDLREVVTTLKIASDLERIGDYAANIAKRSLVLAQTPPVRPAAAIPRMGRMVAGLMTDVLDAVATRDVVKAVDVWRRDEELDDLYTSLFREVLTYMMEDARTITPCTHMLFIAKNLERIGDHVTNIAETVHFVVKGVPLKGLRPKGDSSSFAMADGSTAAGADGHTT